MSREPAILFVGHDAYRAGAQIALLRLLQWLRSRLPARPIVLLKRGGNLLDEYRAIAPTYLLPAPDSSRSVSQYARVLTRHILRMGSSRPRVPSALARIPVGLIYVNSVASLDMLPVLRTIWRCPVICHVHELEMGIRGTIGSNGLHEALAHIDAFVAVSQAVTDNLCLNHRVPRQAVHTIYGILPDPASRPRSTDNASTRQRLGIPSEAFVVGGCGTLDWRKAPDVFVQIARQLVSTRSDLLTHFVWVGGDHSGFSVDALRHDVERLGLGTRIHFLGSIGDVLAYFAAFDTFLLTSREDPFPLVCLEAASLGIPIVCFAKAGGMPEFVGTEAGFVVPYLDVPAAATSLASLADLPELRLRLGQRAQQKAAAHHVDTIAKDILQLIESNFQHPAPS